MHAFFCYSDLQDAIPLFDCKTASMTTQQRKDVLTAPSFPHSDTQMPDTLQPSVCQSPPPDAASPEEELWPLEETDRLAAQVRR